MKFSQEILIDLPRQSVVDLMKDSSKYRFWQRGFISYKHLSGLQGKEGERSRLKFHIGPREIHLIQTLILVNIPKKFFVTYETKGIFTTRKHYFEKVAENKTRWIIDTEIQFTGFMKITGYFKKGRFTKQSQLMMQEFKNYAENEKKYWNN